MRSLKSLALAACLLLGIGLPTLLPSATHMAYAVEGTGVGAGGIWAWRSGDFVSKKFDGTFAGMQAAADYCFVGGNPGGYIQVAPITIAGWGTLTVYAKTEINGGGPLATLFVRSGGATGPAIREKTAGEGNTGGATGIVVKDCSFWGNGSSGNGIDFGNQGGASFNANAYLSDVLVRDFASGTAIRLLANAIHCRDIWGTASLVGLDLVTGGGANHISGGWFESNTDTQMKVGCPWNTFDHTQIEQTGSAPSGPLIDLYNTAADNNMFNGVYMSMETNLTNLIVERSGVAGTAYHKIRVNANGHTYTNTIYDEVWATGTGAQDHLNERLDGANSNQSIFYDKSSNTKTIATGSSFSMIASRIGPYSTTTTGGAIRIVDGVTFPLTAAGVNAAIADLPNRGGTVIVPADSIPFGTNTITITKNYVTLLGAGGRASVFSYTGSGRFFQWGTDDGNHSGVPNAYNGLASGCKIVGIRLVGPGKSSSATAITDWDSGSNTIEDVTIDAWGTGFFGVGADYEVFNQDHFINNGTAAFLGSRCDQVKFNDCDYAQNTYGIVNQWAYGMRVDGGQQVFADSADIAYDVTATPASGGDTRSGSQRGIITGTWFEGAGANSPPRHIQLGVNGAGSGSRIMTGLTITGCEWFSSNADTFVSIQAFGDVDLLGNGYSGIAATLIRVNPVFGWAPIVHDFPNHMSSAIKPLAGSGDTTYVYRLEPESALGWLFKGTITGLGKETLADSLRIGRGVRVTNGNVVLDDPSSEIQFTRAGAQLVNATNGSLRLRVQGVDRFEANTLGVAITGATSSTGTVTVGDDTGDSLVAVGSARLTKGIYVGGQFVNKILRGSGTLDFDLTAVTTQDLTFTLTGAALGDEVFLGVPNGSVTTTVQYVAWVSAANTIKVRADALAVGENPASGTFKVTVFQ